MELIECISGILKNMNDIKLLTINELSILCRHYCQENEQYNNKKGVLRGLHYQIEPYGQSKLVHVAKGKVLNIALDIRKNSDTFGKYVSFELDDVEKKAMLIPKGYAHGYVTLSDESIFIYQVDQYFNIEAMRGIAFNDEYLNIDWKINKEEIFVSEKDAKSPKFSECEFYKGNYE